MRLKLNLFSSLIVGCLAAMFVPVALGDSEIVVATRYLQAAGTSHSHLYLYREDGKLLRQLTDDNSGQDVDPTFSPDGETIVFTREKANEERDFWGIEPRGTNLKRLDSAPEWYKSAKDSPYFTTPDEQQGESGTPSPAPSAEESPSLSRSPGIQQTQHSTGSALDASSNAEDKPPAKIDAPDGTGEIFWRKGKDEKDPLDWVMWFRDSKSGHETEIGKLPGFPSFDPLQVPVGKDRQFLFEGSLRLIFFSSHLDSTDGDTVVAFNFDKQKLVKLSPNWVIPIPLPGEAAFLTVTDNRYVKIPGSSKTANCSYMERWSADLHEKCAENEAVCDGHPEVRYARQGSAAICYGASMYRPGRNPAIITIRRGGE
jgi:WD40 repeat protein